MAILGGAVLLVLSVVVVFLRGGSPQASSPAVAEARLTVLTEPGAIVSLGERTLGTADASGQAGPFSVPAAEQLVRVHHSGLGFARERSMPLQPDQNYFLEIRGRTGWIRLIVAPWARVTIDGKPMGLTPLPRIGLLEGLHRVRLENDDIARFHETQIRIEAGRESVVRVDLEVSGDQL